jgi:pseudaminic acid biosynthesis-associated methylase
MPETTVQAKRWDGEFGRQYTDRHPETVEGFNKLRKNEQYGTTQLALFKDHFGELDRDLRILEVGTNIGIQLRMLCELGFHRLYGIDVQRYALEKCVNHNTEFGIAQADALHLPFSDDSFDLVFTNETLVMIPPEHIETAMQEIIRCSRKWIWGLEHYADEYTEIEYRGRDRMLWKANFPAIYSEQHDGLELIKRRQLEFLENDNQDVMFLFELT